MIEVYLCGNKVEPLNDINHRKYYQFEMYVDKGKLMFKSKDPLQFRSIYDNEIIDLFSEKEYWVFPKKQKNREEIFKENLYNTFGSYIIQTKNNRESILVTINSNQKEYNEMLYDLLEISSELIEGNTRVTGYLNKVLDPNNSEEKKQLKDLERLLQKIETAETSLWDFKNTPIVKRKRYNSSNLRESVQAQFVPEGSKIKKKKLLRSYDTNANRYVKFQLKMMADGFLSRKKLVSKRVDDGTSLLEKMDKLSSKVNKLLGLNLTIFVQKLYSQKGIMIINKLGYEERLAVNSYDSKYYWGIKQINEYINEKKNINEISSLLTEFENLLTKPEKLTGQIGNKYIKEELELQKRLYSLLNKLPFSEVQIPDGYTPQIDQTFFHSPWYQSLLQEFQRQCITFSAFPTPEIFQQREFTPERITALYEKWILVKLIYTLVVDLNFEIAKNDLTNQLITFLANVDKNSERIQMTFKKKKINLTLHYDPILMVSKNDNEVPGWGKKNPDIVLVMEHQGKKCAAIADAKLRNYRKNNKVSNDLLEVAIKKYGRTFIKIKKEEIPIVSSFIFHSSSNHYYDKRYNNFHIGYVENPDEKGGVLFRENPEFGKHIKGSAHRYGVLTVSPTYFQDLKKWIAMNLEYHMKVEDYCWDCGAETEDMIVIHGVTKSDYPKKICVCSKCRGIVVVTHCNDSFCNRTGTQFRLFKRKNGYHERSNKNDNNVVCPKCYGKLGEISSKRNWNVKIKEVIGPTGNGPMKLLFEYQGYDFCLKVWNPGSRNLPKSGDHLNFDIKMNREYYDESYDSGQKNCRILNINSDKLLINGVDWRCQSYNEFPF